MIYRAVVPCLALLGMAANIWITQPADPMSLGGWLFAALWAGAAWICLFVLSIQQLTLASAFSALVCLALSEWAFFNANSDGFLFVVKPLFQLAIFGIGAAVGYFLFRKSTKEAPPECQK